MGLTRRLFLGAGAAAATAPGQSDPQVQLVVPEDGGTPRDPKRIVRLGPSEFRIAASVEEGKSPLTHAVSRIDVIARNGGAARDLVLHLDLSGEGSRPNFDTSYYGGMPKRDFIYVQRPGEPWQRVDGGTSGWVANIQMTLPPGDTKIGLAPWYTYGDYHAYIAGLKPHPHLKKSIIGKSDRGREHWELTITDPAAPATGKRRVFWHAREHAYETFSSFAIEGVVDFLLSDEAAGIRKRYEFVLHPMTNLDGVALGYEYRGGYDFPQPQGTATGKLTFATVDRLRPDFAIAWHNWTAPRDFQVVFYTDSEDGKATRRAWDVMTQHMPSPRAVGHRWDADLTPLRHNWFGRQLSDGNVHQYTMKHYGTRIWGWEMPWWGRDEGDPASNARELGRQFARAWVTAVESKWTAPPEAAPVETARWQMHEFELHGRPLVDNPFRDAVLVGEFTSPSGKTVVVDGFHDGGDTWRLRFAPEEEGEWKYLLRGEGVALYQTGRMRAGPAATRGFIRIHPGNPYAFAYADGSAFFPMGDTCYGLFDDSPITPALRKEYLETRRKQEFNFVRLSIGHSPWRAAADPTYWAWGGTEKAPDYDRLNPGFFHAFERLLREMRSAGMNAEVLLFNYYRRPFTDPKVWSASRERLWLRNVIARYAAFDNVFLWTLSNEYETHPDGKYRLDNPGDVKWAKDIGRAVKELDPCRHPYTVHPVVSSTTKGASPRDPFESPWQIGGFFGEGDEVDVLSQQTATPYAGIWDESLQAWTGDAAGVEASIRADRRFRKPVLNTENGYEYLRGYATNRRQVHETAKVRRAAWRIACSGGYFACGFISTVGHSDNWDRIDPGSKHPFVVKSEGAAGQMTHLYRLFADLPFWKMQPDQALVRGDALCLAEPGEAYAVYAPHGGKVAVNVRLGRSMSARWMDPRNGEFVAAGPAAGGWNEFDAPGSDDWALVIR
jgi:hypothetical protein